MESNSRWGAHKLRADASLERKNQTQLSTIREDRALRSGRIPVVLWRLESAVKVAPFLGFIFACGLSGCGVTEQALTSMTGSQTLVISTQSVDFGRVPVGHAASATVTVTNTGAAPMQVTHADVHGAEFSLAGPKHTPVSLGAGKSYGVGLIFHPISAGATTGTLVLASNASSSSQVTVALSGNGATDRPEVPSLNALTCAADSMSGSGTDPCKVTVTTPAGLNGFNVKLASSSTAVLVPEELTIPAGASQVTFAAAISEVNRDQTAQLIASSAGINKQYSIQLSGSEKSVSNASLRELSCATSSMDQPGTDPCSVVLSAPAPAGGLNVELSSSSEALSVPSSLIVPAGTTQARFFANVSAVKAPMVVRLSASTRGATKSYTIHLAPPAAGILSGLTCVSGWITGSATDSCVVTLNAPANSGGAVVQIARSNPAVSVPDSVAIPAGATHMAFAITVSSVTKAQRADLTASAGGLTDSYTIELEPAVADAVGALTCKDTLMTHVGVDPCMVTLSAPAGSGGVAVRLTSSSKAVSVPFSIVVPAGGTSEGFTSTISSVSTSQSVQLIASASGVAQSYTIELSSAATITIAGLSCDNAVMATPGSDSCTVILTGRAGPGGMWATLTSSSSNVSVPRLLFVPAGGTSGTFAARISAAITTTEFVQLTASVSSIAKSYRLQIEVPASSALADLSCSNSAVTKAETLPCTVTLGAAAPSGGLTVRLTSSSKVVSVPGALSVPAGSTTATFVATVAAMSATQSVQLKATGGGATKTCVIQLKGAFPALTLQSTNVTYGNVTVNTLATQTVLLTSSGTAALTISGVTFTGTGFSLVDASFPLILQPGQTADLQIQFDPKTAGVTTGGAILKTNASAGTERIALSGTGQATSYVVDLTWDAPPISGDPIAGYDVYRALSGSSSYQRLTSYPEDATSYSDITVQNGTSYTYYVVSVDVSGNRSAPSDLFNASIP